MISKIWLQQPIAFARVGSSSTPLAAFCWTKPDLRPAGSGRTTVVPAPSFAVHPESGKLRELPAEEITLFRDEEGVRPVCPFFELHGDCDGQSTALTVQHLRDSGFTPQDLVWRIHLANHKAYSLTHSDGDRIEAKLTIQAGDHKRHPLLGESPETAAEPLVPRGCRIPMGALQVVCPTDENSVIRLRFYAPPGHAYAPRDVGVRLHRTTGIIDRVLDLLGLNDNWKNFNLPKERWILNPAAAWPRHRLLTSVEFGPTVLRLLRRLRAFLALTPFVQRSEKLRFLLGPTADAGKLPPGVYAFHSRDRAIVSSLGMVDDLGDGIITCELGRNLKARARIVVCPPDFAPDRRPPVSIADVLADRTRRADPRAPDWIADWPAAEAEIDDLLDRAYETAGLANLDAWAVELGRENASNAVYRNDPRPPQRPYAPLWRHLQNDGVLDLPLTQRAHWRHRRNSADEFFEQLVRDHPRLIEHAVRDPSEPGSLYYDRRMPALMRGADRRPLHLTRRQLEALRRWAEKLRELPARPVR